MNRSIKSALVALAALVVPAVAQVEPLEPENIIVWWQCSSNCNSNPADTRHKPSPENPMCMSYGLERDFDNGWLKHLTTRVYPQYEQGYRRFFFHLPFGSEYGNHSMDLDQPLDNIEEGKAEFNENFMRALDWMGENMPEAEIGVYLGTNEDDLDAELNAGNVAAHWERMSGAGYNIRLIENPQVSIGFDAGVRYRDGDPYHSFYMLAKAYKDLQGRSVYIEAMPRRPDDYRGDGRHGPPWAWQNVENWVAFERAYFHQHRRWLPDIDNASPTRLEGQGVRVILSGQDVDRWNQLAEERGYANDDLFDWVVDCHENGYEFAIGLTNPAHPWKGMSAQDFADTVNARMGFDTEPEPDPIPDTIDKLLTMRIVNAVVGDYGNGLGHARALQIHPVINIDNRFSDADNNIFDNDFISSLRASSKAAAIAKIACYRAMHGTDPWMIYCDEIPVSQSLSPVVLHWWATEEAYRPAGMDPAQLRSKSDALFEAMCQIQLGFLDAIAELNAETVPAQGFSSGPIQRDEMAWSSWLCGSQSFANVHQDHPIRAVITWDYWGLGADNDLEGFAGRSKWRYAGNRTAFEVPVVRVFRTVKLDPEGQIVRGPDGTPVPWTNDQVMSWWVASPNVDPKGVWEIGYGAHISDAEATAPRVLHMFETLYNPTP